jgi:hypothetical protein
MDGSGHTIPPAASSRQRRLDSTSAAFTAVPRHALYTLAAYTETQGSDNATGAATASSSSAPPEFRRVLLTGGADGELVHWVSSTTARAEQSRAEQRRAQRTWQRMTH